MIEPEDFAEWFAHPVTEAVLRLLDGFASEQQAEWLRQSWGGGLADQTLLTELRTRADAYRAIAELTPERLAELSGES